MEYRYTAILRNDDEAIKIEIKHNNLNNLTRQICDKVLRLDIDLYGTIIDKEKEDIVYVVEAPRGCVEYYPMSVKEFLEI